MSPLRLILACPLLAPPVAPAVSAATRGVATADASAADPASDIRCDGVADQRELNTLTPNTAYTFRIRTFDVAGSHTTTLVSDKATTSVS